MIQITPEMYLAQCLAHSKHLTNVSNYYYYTYNHNKNCIVNALKEMLNAEEVHRKESSYPAEGS